MFYDALIAPFTEFEFMRRALAAVIALALGAAPIGVFLMLRRMSLVGDAMAHAILPGAAIGFLVSGLNLFAMTTGGLIAGFTVAILAGLVYLIQGAFDWDAPRIDPLEGSVASVGTSLFSRFVLPFEVISLLLLAALIGAIVLSRKEDRP